MDILNGGALDFLMPTGILTGVIGLVGVALKLRSELVKVRTDDQFKRAERNDDNIWQLVKELRLERDQWRETAGRLQASFDTLQARFQEVLERQEELEMEKRKDRTKIAKLEKEVAQLKRDQ